MKNTPRERKLALAVHLRNETIQRLNKQETISLKDDTELRMINTIIDDLRNKLNSFNYE